MGRNTETRQDRAEASATVNEQATTIDTLVFPDVPDAPRGRRGNGELSIRGIIRAGLLQGKNTASIAAVVKANFPESAAALKSSKHIGFYRSQMKKAGELPTSSK